MPCFYSSHSFRFSAVQKDRKRGQKNLMKSSNFLLILAGVLSFVVAVFQAVISFVPEWSAALGAGDALAIKTVRAIS